MAHRSVPAPSPSRDVDTDVDPFWQDAFRQRPPIRERAAERLRPLQSWVVAAVGVVAVLGAGWWLLRPAAPPIESALPAAEAATAAPGSAGASAPPAVGASTTSSTIPADLVVQAAGAVAKPGVYELEVGARVDDLIEAAGGLTAKADTDRVNLAAPVADGERVWVPTQGEDAPPDVVAGLGGGSGNTGSGAAPGAGKEGTRTATPASPVDLNTATAEELDALPGVGPATATAILGYRDEHGRFSSVDELLDVRGIGEAKLEQLRPLVRV